MQEFPGSCDLSEDTGGLQFMIRVWRGHDSLVDMQLGLSTFGKE